MNPMQRRANGGHTVETAENAGPQLEHNRRWCAQVGIAQLILGMLALATITLAAPNAIIFVGWLLVVSGLAEAVHAFHLRNSSAFFFHLVPAIAGIPVGILIVTHPGAGSTAWMLVFASSFTMIGLFRSIAAFRLKFHNWQWSAIDGIGTFLLATLFWTTSSWLAPWYFCLATGATLILRGLSSIMFGLGLPTPAHSQPVHPSEQTNAFASRFLQRRSH